MICAHNFSVDQIEKNEMGGACSACWEGGVCNVLMATRGKETTWKAQL